MCVCVRMWEEKWERWQERFHLCEAQTCSSTCTQKPILHTHWHTRTDAHIHPNPAPLPLRHSLVKRERRRDSKEGKGEGVKKWIQSWSVLSGFSPAGFTLWHTHTHTHAHPKVFRWKWLSDCFLTKTLLPAEKQTVHLSGYQIARAEIDFTYNSHVHLVHFNTVYLQKQCIFFSA